VPFVLRWPARAKPATSDALVTHTDLLASFASLVGQPHDKMQAPDSQNLLPALLGESKTAREEVVLQGTGGLALRRGDWKYIPPMRGQRKNASTRTELGNEESPQLYNLATDLGEQQNLAAKEPERVKELAARLEQIRQ